MRVTVLVRIYGMNREFRKLVTPIERFVNDFPQKVESVLKATNFGSQFRCGHAQPSKDL